VRKYILFSVRTLYILKFVCLYIYIFIYIYIYIYMRFRPTKNSGTKHTKEMKFILNVLCQISSSVQLFSTLLHSWKYNTKITIYFEGSPGAIRLSQNFVGIFWRRDGPSQLDAFDVRIFRR